MVWHAIENNWRLWESTQYCGILRNVLGSYGILWDAIMGFSKVVLSSLDFLHGHLLGSPKKNLPESPGISRNLPERGGVGGEGRSAGVQRAELSKHPAAAWSKIPQISWKQSRANNGHAPSNIAQINSSNNSCNWGRLSPASSRIEPQRTHSIEHHLWASRNLIAIVINRLILQEPRQNQPTERDCSCQHLFRSLHNILWKNNDNNNYNSNSKDSNPGK